MYSFDENTAIVDIIIPLNDTHIKRGLARLHYRIYYRTNKYPFIRRTKLKRSRRASGQIKYRSLSTLLALIAD